MRLMKAMPAEDNFYGEQETIREIVPDSLYQLLLPPTDVGYTSKERFCEEIQQFTIQHGYGGFTIYVTLTLVRDILRVTSEYSNILYYGAPQLLKLRNRGSLKRLQL